MDALVVAVSPNPFVTTRLATQDVLTLRVVSTVRSAAAPVVTRKVSPIARAGARPVQLRLHARVQLPGVPGQLLPEALSATVAPAVTLMTGSAGVIAAVGGEMVTWQGVQGAGACSKLARDRFKQMPKQVVISWWLASTCLG